MGIADESQKWETTVKYIFIYSLEYNCRCVEDLQSLTVKHERTMTNNEQSTGHKRVLQGKVVSNKPVGGKTVVVEVERRVLHPKYKKFVRSRAKYHAHDENNECNINDEVQIQESRPLSKTKRWVVTKNLGSEY